MRDLFRSSHPLNFIPQADTEDARANHGLRLDELRGRGIQGGVPIGEVLAKALHAPGVLGQAHRRIHGRVHRILEAQERGIDGAVSGQHRIAARLRKGTGGVGVVDLREGMVVIEFDFITNPKIALKQGGEFAVGLPIGPYGFAMEVIGRPDLGLPTTLLMRYGESVCSLWL
jgi:hypothetical protein